MKPTRLACARRAREARKFGETNVLTRWPTQGIVQIYLA